MNNSVMKDKRSSDVSGEANRVLLPRPGLHQTWFTPDPVYTRPGLQQTGFTAADVSSQGVFSESEVRNKIVFWVMEKLKHHLQNLVR